MPEKDYHRNGGVRAINRMIRVSPYKLNLVAASIRGLVVGEAINRLTFSRKSVAESVLKTLNSAIANAEHNHKMDVDTLHVAHAFVGKSLVMKRMRFHARGRVGRVKKPFSRLTIVVQEPQNQEQTGQAEQVGK